MDTEVYLAIIMIFMIIAALTAIHARDLLSAVIAQGAIGYGLVLCFLLLKAPDLAIVQIVAETITIIIMVAVLHDSTRFEIRCPFCRRDVVNYSAAIVLAGVLLYFFVDAIAVLQPFGEHTLRMSEAYVYRAIEEVGVTNFVKGVLWDFRALDTMGEAAVLFTTAMGVLAILRLKGKKI
ncbi:MAG: DUF4040 domain-containing protein [Bacteroidetes bacterium]|nr:MAG: DUF4040 domain-containing protein [Bacteroidota bacterium]